MGADNYSYMYKIWKYVWIGGEGAVISTYIGDARRFNHVELWTIPVISSKYDPATKRPNLNHNPD
jgi:hypothetical protein